MQDLSNISEIFGTLGVDGAANLFLINPNGIVFGKNAAIDVGGSFLATTAESIEFRNGASFTTTDKQTEPILTVDFPIGLGMSSNPGDPQNPLESGMFKEIGWLVNVGLLEQFLFWQLWVQLSDWVIYGAFPI